MEQGKPDPTPAPAKRSASFGATMKAVFWSFFGIRKRADYEKDSASLNPVHVIIAALIGVLVFIGVLLTVVHFAIGK
jgi:amino acid transporter